MKLNVLSRVLTLLATTSLVIAGCSNNASVVSSTGWPATPSIVTYWLPVTAGVHGTYEERASDGSVRTTGFVVGKQVPFLSGSAVEWFTTDGRAVNDTSYLVVSDSAILVYENSSSLAERILKLPLTPGARWKRYTGYDDTDRDTVSIVTGDTVSGGMGGGGYAKIFPTMGSNEMWVDRWEDIILKNGSSHTGTLKVVNTNENGTQNCYWFSPGIGLVKYALQASNYRPDGTISGELVYYRR